jgi:hypothetical protein
MSHSSLQLYYKTVFSLAQHHKYSVSELESLIPYERDVYVDMLLEYLNNQKANQ